MKLTKNFSLEELTRSDTAERKGIDNSPTAEHIHNLAALCENVLQPLRDKLKHSIRVTSGYRSEKLNKAIGGASRNGKPTSEHCYGKAADIWIESWPSNNLMDDIDRNKRVDVYDCEYLVELVRILETEGNVLTGGASAYRWISTHGPFVHIDIRGSRASWPTARTLVSDPVI